MAARQAADAGSAPALASASASASGDVAEIQRALARFAHMITRARQHDRITVGTGVQISRAGVPILRLLRACGPLRPGEIAAQLGVEPPHIARQVHQLGETGYVELVPDPSDGRARHVQLTAAGRQAIDRIDEMARQQMLRALGAWTPQERGQLAAYLTRMVDDFITNMTREEEATSASPSPSLDPPGGRLPSRLDPGRLHRGQRGVQRDPRGHRAGVRPLDLAEPDAVERDPRIMDGRLELSHGFLQHQAVGSARSVKAHPHHPLP
jgi:DNA-binding MarR family transcriptional regulator